VGIGTSSPATNGATFGTLSLNGSNGGALHFMSANTTVMQLYNDANAFFINASSSKSTIFQTASTERMRITSAGDVGIGTSSPSGKLHVAGGANSNNLITSSTGTTYLIMGNVDASANAKYSYMAAASQFLLFGKVNDDLATRTEYMRIDSSGRVLVGTTSTNLCAGDTVGIGLNTTIDGTYAVGAAQFSANGTPALNVNRKTDDGSLVTFSQAGTSEGTISVSGTTVSYNGGHLSRWAQTTAPKDDTLVKGTVLSNLNAMNVYTDADGNPVDNEQLNKVKVSDVEGDVNVAGVFVNWTYDDAHDVDEINMAMTGDMIIRIAQGVTVARGDLLMSAGDGTAKPQGDDIVRSKTVAKVTSTHITCTYEDGSYCVPCVLMAC